MTATTRLAGKREMHHGGHDRQVCIPEAALFVVAYQNLHTYLWAANISALHQPLRDSDVTVASHRIASHPTFNIRRLLLRVDYTYTSRDSLLLRTKSLVYVNRPMLFT